VFGLVRRFRPRAQTKTGALEPPAPITLLAVTHNPDGWSDLREIAQRSGWLLRWAPSCQAAVELIERDSFSLVICDRDVPGQDWRAVVQRIASLQPRVCVLLASSVCDEYLWKEVAQHGGFDVVAKPFDADRLERAVKLASSWRGWSQDCAARPALRTEPRP
jgi:DNA-binding NtrC family response regulator